MIPLRPTWSLALVLMSAAATTPPAEAQEPAERALAAPCDRARLAGALGLEPRRWLLDCLSLGEGRLALAAVPLADLTPGRRKGADSLTVWVATARGTEITWRDEVQIGAESSEVREAVEKSEDWFVVVDAQPLDGDRGLRVGVMGQWGGRDRQVAREIVLLYRLAAEGAPVRLWVGTGNARESRHEHCIVESIARFRIVEGASLERHVQVRARLEGSPRGLSRAAARKLRSDCVAKERPAERFPLAR